ncbi:DUF397 domain-containing protein [Actinomadura rupiterrae]|uniref:DUF397 domain-containing protein n=1 Tax=Actinomadura rupiterrae TaxID=559627 RepID=UPI0020A4B93A|nr:DUF397 domain-containing protein [Actinomadura rupiterrae]MCP2343058.1 hypothetical protein [Actinomadura rupiterrae]
MFIKSGQCGGPCSDGCVNVAIVREAVIVADEKGGTSVFDHREWADFVAGVKQGEFDVPSGSEVMAASGS